MKTIALLAIAVTAALASPNPLPWNNPPSGCNDDDCARAVTGTRTGKMPDITSRKSDCSSYMTATVYTGADGQPEYTHAPTAVPDYACSACGPAPTTGYSSACSCWGITTATVTTCW